MKDYIEKSIAKNDVVVFMKGDPAETSCSYSSRAIKILDHYGVDYASENVMQSEGLRKGVKAYSGVKTLPQIFINGTYYGGSDDLCALHETGALTSVLQAKKIASCIDSAQPALVFTVVKKDEITSCGIATAPRRKAG